MQYLLMSDSFLVDDPSKCETPKNNEKIMEKIMKISLSFCQMFTFFELVCCIINRQQYDW